MKSSHPKPAGAESPPRQNAIQQVLHIAGQPDGAPSDRLADDCASIVINFNTARQTLRNIRSQLDGALVPAAIHVLDNASAEEDFHWLRDNLPQQPACPVYLYRSAANLGFAGGSNALLLQALDSTDIRYVLLLNNDAVAMPMLLQKLRQALLDGAAENIHMAGARMHRLDTPDEADTLGIALYASLMPADRKTTDDLFVGPTGGCALYSRHLLERLQQVGGYWFDSRFFCYWEDTDLALRSRLLGLQAVYIDEVLALHEGQASSSNMPGNPDHFIAYHALRNSFWMHLKLLPGRLLLRHGFYLLTAHLLTALLYVATGRGGSLWRAWRDAWSGRRAFLEERKIWHKAAPDAAARLRAAITPRFYRKGYLATAFGKAKNH